MSESMKCVCDGSCRCNARFNGTMSVDEFIEAFTLTKPQIETLKQLRLERKLK